MDDLPDDTLLEIACDAMKDVGLDEMAELFTRLVKEERSREEARLRYATYSSNPENHAGGFGFQIPDDFPY